MLILMLRVPVLRNVQNDLAITVPMNNYLVIVFLWP
jgi:hypothetical protein